MWLLDLRDALVPIDKVLIHDLFMTYSRLILDLLMTCATPQCRLTRGLARRYAYADAHVHTPHMLHIAERRTPLGHV